MEPEAASNNLEKIETECLIARRKGDPRIMSYVHDNDGGTRNVIVGAGWDINKILDPGYARKSIASRMMLYNQQNQKIRVGTLVETRYAHLITKSYLSVDARVRLWKDTWRRCCADHQFCLHGDIAPCARRRTHLTNEDAATLQRFFEETVDYVD
jgi:hypothetical protein